jgi:hypothetical protein
MTYTIDDETMRYYSVMTPQEVAEQLTWCGELNLEDGERIVSVTLECGCDLEVTIRDGENEYTREFTEWDIKQAFDQPEWVVWAKDENGNDVLLCFGC